VTPSQRYWPPGTIWPKGGASSARPVSRVTAYWPEASDSQPALPSSKRMYHSFQKPAS
jgi:hypothetical protein